MPGCALTQDYTFGCDVGAGGLKELYLIELENIATVTDSSGTVTGITKASGKIFRKYQLVQETANFGEDIAGNRQNGTLVFPQRGVIVINKQSVAVRNEILLLAKNRLAVVTKDNNGDYRLYGWSNGLMLQTGAAESGTAWEDRNGYTMNFTGKERELAYFVQESVIATLQTPG